MRQQISNQVFRSLQTGALGFIFLIGLGIRLSEPLRANFPLNDGGLFYAMIEDLKSAGYGLPAYATYNGGAIPFAYPPFAFYVTGLISDFTNIPLLGILRLLPAFVSSLCILAFYLLARQITASNTQTILSTLAFALLPRTFDWLIMGGGVTRSFGLLFALLTMTFVFRLFTSHSGRTFWACILLGALVVLAHPEATVHTAITCLVFFLWKGRSRWSLGVSFGIAASILVLTSPWWGLIIFRHSLDPFLASINAARQNSFNPLVGLVVFFRFLFADEPYLTILSSIGAIGFFASLARRQTLLPAWLLILHLVEPRGGTLYMMIPLALLIGYALENILLPALRPKGDNPTPANARYAFESIMHVKSSRYFLIFLFIYSVISAYTTSFNIKNDLSIKLQDQQAFTWVREHTPQHANFILITGQNPLRDAWSEWFPVVAKRKSLATVFGYEWVNDGKFADRINAYKDLQACKSRDALCLDEWTRKYGETIDYVYIKQPSESGPFVLNIYLDQNPSYKIVFQNEQTAIYQHLQAR